MFDPIVGATVPLTPITEPLTDEEKAFIGLYERRQQYDGTKPCAN